MLGAVCGGVTITGLPRHPAGRCGHSGHPAPLRRKFTRTGAASPLRAAPARGGYRPGRLPRPGPRADGAGLLCEGTTVIRNAERLRLKESDRIAAMEAELRACGGVLESEGGTITVHGVERLHAPPRPCTATTTTGWS